MRLHKLYVALRVLRQLEQMPSVGEGGIKLSDVTFWSGMKRQTTYRKLIELEKIGLAKREYHPYKNTSINYWKTTEMGKEAMLPKEMGL